MRYKHIIWDWNGTLFEDVSLCCDIMNNILKRRKLHHISVEDYREIFTFPVINYYQNVGLDLEKYPFEELSIEFITEYEEKKFGYSLYNGVKDTLSKVQKLGISQSILSAYSQNTLEEVVEHFEIGKYFEKVIGLDNIYAASKVANGKRWIEQLNLNGSEVLLIGDSLHDKEVADEINSDCVLLTHGHQNKKALLKSNAKLFNSFSDLLIFINNNFKS